VRGEKVFLVKHDGLEHTIYESAIDDEKPKKVIPTIIDEINEYLNEGTSEDVEKFKVETIAEKVGINTNTLDKWVRTDQEFSDPCRLFYEG
jgi:hypothetical protein